MEKKLKKQDPIKQILDENNTENVFLYDENNKPIEFEQIALIPLEETDKLYAILVPLNPMENVGEGEAVLFEIDEQANDISVVNDDEIIDKVYTIYEKLINQDKN